MGYLFICGAPRSGTTAMWRLLVNDDRLIIGVERYGNLFFKTPLTAELFTKERFCNLQSGDTFYSSLESFNKYYIGIEDRFERARYVGDKIPLLFKHLASLFERIPNAKVIIMLRNIVDVAASYEARANDQNDTSWNTKKRTSSAIADWRDSLIALKKHVADQRILPVVYEDFFFGNVDARIVYKFLDLESTARLADDHKNILTRSSNLEGARTRDLPLQAVREICENAPFGLYREVLKLIRQRLDSSNV